MGKACSLHGENINIYRALVGKKEGKVPLGGPTRILNNNIKMGCLNLVRDRDQWKASINTVINCRVPQHFGKRGCGMLYVAWRGAITVSNMF
jgi:hypothetical protein